MPLCYHTYHTLPYGMEIIAFCIWWTYGIWMALYIIWWTYEIYEIPHYLVIPSFATFTHTCLLAYLLYGMDLWLYAYWWTYGIWMAVYIWWIYGIYGIPHYLVLPSFAAFMPREGFFGSLPSSSLICLPKFGSWSMPPSTAL